MYSRPLTFDMLVGFNEIGGIDALWDKFPNAAGEPFIANKTNATGMSANATANYTSSCYTMTKYWGNMFRPLDDPDYPWLGLWLSLPIIGIWYWCTDQVSWVIVHYVSPCAQFVSSVDSLAHCKTACFTSSLICAISWFYAGFVPKRSAQFSSILSDYMAIPCQLCFAIMSATPWTFSDLFITCPALFHSF